MTNKPVVALETTIYTHGFPYPDNVALALELEGIVRSNGAVPATIGILDGVARIGLSTEELIALTSSAGKPETMKVSRRDIPYIIGMVSRSFSSLISPVYSSSKTYSLYPFLYSMQNTKVKSRVSLDVS
jgi:pseudouridine-5'-phosphate glycosidase